MLHIMHSVEQLLPDNPQMGRPGAAFLARANSTPFIIPYRLNRNAAVK